MANKTPTTTPHRQLTQTEWRIQLEPLLGVTYANLSTNMQTIFDRVVDWSIEKVSEIPWV